MLGLVPALPGSCHSSLEGEADSNEHFGLSLLVVGLTVSAQRTAERVQHQILRTQPAQILGFVPTGRSALSLRPTNLVTDDPHLGHSTGSKRCRKSLSTTAHDSAEVVQVENRGGEAQGLGASLACHGSTSLTTSRDRPPEDPNVMFAGAFSGKSALWVCLLASTTFCCAP